MANLNTYRGVFIFNQRFMENDKELKLSSAYSAKDVEENIYKSWLDSGYFNPDNLPLPADAENYTIIMPPPNANGAMHVGHALFLTIQDILIRYNRMRGKRTLWLPGTDHAGFETQVVFEKKLEKEGRSRFKMQREEFYKETFDFVQANKEITEKAIMRLGASCDWSRNIFTLDPRIIKIVYETFKELYEDGLIYRGNRIGHWCVKHQTALSELETKYEEREDPLYFIKYGPLEVATVRPETVFGDTGLAVNPEDPRYKQYVGKNIEVQTLLGKKSLPVIADAAVDANFGTGVVKITPAHDQLDFDIWQRHQNEIAGPLSVIDRFGKLNEHTGPYQGLKVKEAREKVATDMIAAGLIDQSKTVHKNKHNVQLCYKCGNVIEPLIIPQWYVAMTKAGANEKKSLRDMAVDAVQNGEIKIIPDRYEKVFMHWMSNLRDWPISRQIWWGIPIPVKYCEDCGEAIVDIEDKISKCEKCGSTKLIKDPDTFDTWFSSGQWPFATLLAHSKNDLAKFYPTSVMETGWDILFFWVARMAMLGIYKTGKVPFKTVYLHGLVRDKDRQKMSKSKGNVIDPLGVIDLYGTDALRFALVFSTAAGNDIPLSEDKIRGMKNFANKLWNIARYVLSAVDNFEGHDLGIEKIAALQKQNNLSSDDQEILNKLQALIKEQTEHLEALRLHEAAQAVYHFVWHEFADKYIEKSKEQLKNPELKENTEIILILILKNILLLLHPFMPFITEEIWKKLNQDHLLIISSWPK